MRRAWVLLIVTAGLLGAGTGPADAGTYRWVTPAGTVVYANRPPQGHETAAPAPADLTVDEVLALSGLKRQMAAMAERIRTDFPQRGVAADEDVAVRRILAQHFDGAVLYATIRDEVARRVDPAKLREVGAWFRSALGRRITGAEVGFATAAGSHRIAEAVAELRREPPSPARLRLVQRLDAATRTTEVALDVSLAVTRGIAEVVEPRLAAGRKVQPALLERQLRLLRAQLMVPMRRAVLLTMLRVYSRFADDELARYVETVESDAGQWFVTAVNAALVHAAGTAAGRSAAELVRVLPPERWRGGGAPIRRVAREVEL